MNYRYDTARRLVSEQDTFTGLTRAYAFDARGNRTRMTVTATATGAELYRVDYTHGSNNRVNTEVRTGQNPSTTTFAHDNNVNMLRRYVNGVLAETKTYNVWGELTRVVTPGMTADYTYRADGLRHTKSVNGVRTTHVWDGAHMAAELNASGVAIIRFTRGRGGRLIHSQHHGWYLHNARGDVVQRVNGAGAAWRTYRYTAFGAELNPVANPNPFRFAGEYYDAETGRLYLRARFYAPRLGRFTQPDPFWGVGNMLFGSSPHTMGHGVTRPDHLAIMQAGNLFVYTMNNPVMWIDPSGMIIQLPNNADDRNAVLQNLQALTRDDMTYIVIQSSRRRYIARYTIVDGRSGLNSGTQLIRNLLNSNERVSIHVDDTRLSGVFGNPTNAWFNGTGASTAVRINPDFNHDVLVRCPLTLIASYSTTPTHIVLAHELIHADRMMRGVAIRPDDIFNHRYLTVPGRISIFGRRIFDSHGNRLVMREDMAVIGLRFNNPGDITENMIRAEHGLPLRVTH